MTDTKSEVHVWVLDVTFFGEYGWTSVHATPEGARAGLEQKVDEYDVRDAYEAEARCETVMEDSMACETDGNMVVWGISRLPVETP